MKGIIMGKKQWVADWISNRQGCGKWQVDFEAIGLASGGELVGGVVIDNYVKDTRCALHVAGKDKRWLSHRFIRIVFDYVFRQLNCNVAIAPIASTNDHALRFVKNLGFTEAGRIEGGAPGGDLVLLQMTKAKCRWLEKKS